MEPLMTYVTPIIIMGGIGFVLAMIIIVVSKYLAEYGVCKITINSSKTIEIVGGESLLSSLFTGKIFIPSACGGRGSCGYCKVRIPEGGGLVLPTEKPFLTSKEVGKNMRLACQVKVKNDLVVELPEEYLSIQEYKAEVVYNKPLTYDIKEVKLKLLDPEVIKFQPGQYIQFHIPVDKDEFIYRAYSISSQPSTPGEVELIVRLVPGGIGSTYIHHLEKGDNVTISGPYGEFTLQEHSEADVICIGGGAGMAPLKAIIYSLFEKKTKRNVYLYFGVRAKKDVFYVEELEKLKKDNSNFNYCFALSSPDENDKWEGETGFIHLVLEKHIEDASNMEAYLCGPPVMTDAAIKVLREKGINKSNIYYDKF